MPINLASPGILIREVDLTIGNVDPTTGKIAGIVGPFEGSKARKVLINDLNALNILLNDENIT